mgnify:CR=1 FL=1
MSHDLFLYNCETHTFSTTDRMANEIKLPVRYIIMKDQLLIDGLDLILLKFFGYEKMLIGETMMARE